MVRVSSVVNDSWYLPFGMMSGQARTNSSGSMARDFVGDHRQAEPVGDAALNRGMKEKRHKTNHFDFQFETPVKSRDTGTEKSPRNASEIWDEDVLAEFDDEGYHLSRKQRMYSSCMTYEWEVTDKNSKRLYKFRDPRVKLQAIGLLNRYSLARQQQLLVTSHWQ